LERIVWIDPPFIRQRERCRFRDGANRSPVGTKEGPKAMAGSPDAADRGRLPHLTASRRLAHGFRPFAKTMRDHRNV
jgi:hypothetical protein